MTDIDTPFPSLAGLVLAGGEGRRMRRRDKGQLRYRGQPQARHAWGLLRGLCGSAYVSVRPEQAQASAYTGLPLVLDEPVGQAGPAAGLLAAWRREPDRAWLVLATDLPFVSAPLLRDLIAGRDANCLATAFRYPDGTLEPLCTIWEPAAHAPLLTNVGAGDASLRRLLEASSVRALEPRDLEQLTNVNTMSEYEAALERMKNE